ncbi:hypothetical protein [Massilia sp.]|uniref:hypothetical protein n=1 Tax=Massilia sp. TaxID=1882437 RepID=UPI002898C21D|nr:hypothetical protein [Massilia sp.]
MNDAQINALTSVAGRVLVTSELDALAPLVAIRNDIAIAALLSTGRTRHGPTQIGSGTIMAVLGDRGGPFLDAVEELGATDRNVYWGLDPVRRGVLDLNIPEGREQLARLKPKLPEYAADIEKVLAVGVVPDPIPFDTVSRALNAAEGRMTL